MKILSLTIDLPYPPVRGAQLRDFALMTRAARQHDVVVMALLHASSTPDEIAGMGALCDEVHALPRPPDRFLGRLRRLPGHLRKGRPVGTIDHVYDTVEAALRERLSKGDIDILQIEHSFMAPYVRAVEVSPKTRTILSMHNIGAVQYRRMVAIEPHPVHRVLAAAKARLMQGWEAPWCNRFDHVIAMSKADAALMQKMGVDRPISVVPNGVALPDSPLPDPTERRALFVGSLEYPPNVDAARWLATKIMPRVWAKDPGVRLTVAGFGGSEKLCRTLQAKGIDVVQNPPDVVPLYQTAALALAALRAGGGTRLKILEALALGRPVVATRLGAEGLGLEHGKTVLFGEDPDTLAAQILRGLDDADLRSGLITNGRALIRGAYEWDTLYGHLDAVYRGLTAPQ
ncbi:MAG: glycosyltransferase family 4 protein [Pseudomonadota bacterium]